MADPISALAITSLIGTAVGGSVTAYGNYQQGQFQSNMYNYQSRVAQINAAISDQQANTEQMAGEVRAQTAGLKGADVVGGTKAAIAAGGLDLGSGSAKGVIASEEEVTQHDQTTTRYDAAQRSYAMRIAGFSQEATAGLDVAAGAGAREAGDIGAYSSVLGGATSVADKWANYKNVGILS